MDGTEKKISSSYDWFGEKGCWCKCDTQDLLAFISRIIVFETFTWKLKRKKLFSRGEKGNKMELNWFKCVKAWSKLNGMRNMTLKSLQSVIFSSNFLAGTFKF